MTTTVELLVIENTRVFDPGIGLDMLADIVVADGTIREIAPGAGQQVSSVDATRRDGSGQWVLPGLLDLSAHLGEPGGEDREDLHTGLRAAARGGFTRVCCTPDTAPVLDSPALVQWVCQRAAATSPVEVLPIAASTVGLEGQSLTEMAALAEAGAVAVGSAHRTIESASALRRVLEYAQSVDLPVFHAADESSLTRGAEMNESALSVRLGLRGSPAIAEQIGLHRDILLALGCGARLHSSFLSSRAAVQLLEQRREEGAITAAVPVANLALTEQSLVSYDPAYRLVPPLRAEPDRQALCDAVNRGVLQAIVTDHRPQVPSRKDCDFSSAAAGAVGLTTCLSVVLDLVERGDLQLGPAIAALTSGPAAVLGLAPSTLRSGASANLCLVDPRARWQVTPQTLGSKCHNSPFLGQQLTGTVQLTLSRGRVAFDASSPL